MYFSYNVTFMFNNHLSIFIVCAILINCALIVAQMVKNLLQCGRSGFDPWVGKIPWRREQQPTPVFLPGEEEPGGLQSIGCKESDMTKRLTHFQ